MFNMLVLFNENEHGCNNEQTESPLSKSGNLTSFSHYISPIPLHPPLFFLSKFSSAHQTVKYRLAIGWLFP